MSEEAKREDAEHKLIKAAATPQGFADSFSQLRQSAFGNAKTEGGK